jgi:hypothetical protein
VPVQDLATRSAAQYARSPGAFEFVAASTVPPRRMWPEGTWQHRRKRRSWSESQIADQHTHDTPIEERTQLLAPRSFCRTCTIWVLPQSQNIRSRRVQTQETTVGGNDLYTSHFTLSINSPPTHQSHPILCYPSGILYFGTKFEPSRS